MTALAFVDTETTGLDPDLHEIWEVALILRTEAGDVEHVWQLPVDLGRADPYALNIGRFHERRLPTADEEHAARMADAIGGLGAMATIDFERVRDVGPHVVDDLVPWCAEFARLTWGAHLVGAVPSFDEERLRRLLRRHGACPGWHYHLIDVEALTIGYLHGALRDTTPRSGIGRRIAEVVGTLPWSSRDLSSLLGVDPEAYDAHTALGDARWARAIYDAVVNPLGVPLITPDDLPYQHSGGPLLVGFPVDEQDPGGAS